MEKEPRVRTPLAAFLVVLVAPLAFLLLMVPGLLAGKVTPFKPAHEAPGVTQFAPRAILPSSPFLPESPGPAAPAPAAPTAGSPPAPAQVLAAATPGAPSTAGGGSGGPVLTDTERTNRGKHKGRNHPADSDTHGNGS